MRLFVGDELIESGVMPRTLMKAQGFDPAPLDLVKAHFNPDQPRWPAGSGRDSGEWSGGANIDTDHKKVCSGQSNLPRVRL